MDTVIVNIDNNDDVLEVSVNENNDVVFARVSGAGEPKEFRIEWSGSYCYVGLAIQGSDESEAIWTIYRIEVFTDGSIERLKKNASKWTERLTATYN